MIFSTNLFIAIFLPAFLAIYYLLPARFRSATILVGSYIFYAWWRVDYLVLIMGMSIVAYLAGHVAQSDRPEPVRRRAMYAGVAAELLALGYFKYATFLMTNADWLSLELGGDGVDVIEILLPIGISFHAFQSISFVIDMYRRDAPLPRNVVDFLTFSTFFPQLLAGPVLRYKDLAEQFVSRSHSLDLFAAGVYRFVQGLAMKILIADSVAPMADLVFTSQDPTLAEAWLGALAYSFQLFFDFAGYSAMAIGLALMVGFRLVENFDDPYLSSSITEFWRRWHISLSNWLRDYLYIPLGGNRRGRVRTYVNLWLTMVLGGFWHGANWTFLLWGMWHGTIMAVERRLGITGARSLLPRAVAVPLTFVLVMIGWVMFRAPQVGVALDVYAGMAGVQGIGIRPELAWQIQPTWIVMLAVAMFIAWLPLWSRFSLGRLAAGPMAVVHVVLAVLVMTRIASQAYAPFLYFQF